MRENARVSPERNIDAGRMSPPEAVPLSRADHPLFF